MTKKREAIRFYDLGIKKHVSLTDYEYVDVKFKGKNGKRLVTYAKGVNPKSGNKVCKIISNCAA